MTTESVRNGNRGRRTRPKCSKKYLSISDMNIVSLVPYLASNRLSVFDSNIDYFLYQKAHNELGNPLSKGALLEGEWCVGAIDNIRKLDVGPAGSTWYEISGWSLDSQMDRSADGVLFSDEEGRIVGIGRMLFADRERSKALNLKHTQLIVHYIGYVKLGSSRSIIGYAFKAVRNNLCRFGETRFIRQ